MRVDLADWVHNGLVQYLFEVDPALVRLCLFWLAGDLAWAFRDIVLALSVLLGEWE
jgi:hypothetical protein